MYVDRQGILQSQEVGEDPSAIIPFENNDSSKPYALVTKQQKMDLKKDLIFKMFLGTKEYKQEVAIPFHQDFWGHLTDIRNLELLTEPILPSTFDSRGAEPDVIWQEPNSGATFLTEMQRRRQEFYPQRISLYEGKMRSLLALKGSNWDYNQVPVYILGLANFKLNRRCSTDFLHEYVSMNPKNQMDLLTNKDWKMLADLKTAKMLSPEQPTEQFKWLYLFNNFHKLAEMPDFMKTEKFDKVIKIANKLKRCKMEELMDYFRQLHKEDRQKEAERKAEARGKKEGKAEGKVEGRLEAIRDFISTQPKKLQLNIHEIATMFRVDENLVRSMLPS